MQDALISLTGHVGTDVDFRQGEGWQLARFRLACTPRRLRDGTWVDQETTWITVNAWGRTAENMKTSLSKGDPVVVTGRLRTTAWQDGDGIRHERLVVQATALGHDLSRGRTEFTRNQKRIVVNDEGHQIDTRTGEIVGRAEETMPEPPTDYDEVPPDEEDDGTVPAEPAREEHLVHL